MFVFIPCTLMLTVPVCLRVCVCVSARRRVCLPVRLQEEERQAMEEKKNVLSRRCVCVCVCARARVCVCVSPSPSPLSLCEQCAALSPHGCACGCCLETHVTAPTHALSPLPTKQRPVKKMRHFMAKFVETHKPEVNEKPEAVSLNTSVNRFDPFVVLDVRTKRVCVCVSACACSIPAPLSASPFQSSSCSSLTD